MRRTGTRTAAVVAICVILPSCARHLPSSDGSEIPGVARVVCSASGTRIETPSVRTHPDGVHVVIDNRLGFDTGFSNRYENGAEGDNAPQGESEHVLRAPPGALEIGCYIDRDAVESDLRTLTVVDPTGIYRSTELDCDSIVEGVSDYVEGATGQHGDPVHLARTRFEQVTDVRADDVIEVAGYPQDDLRTVRLVRDGRVTATISFYASGRGGWLEDTFARCDELVV